MEKEIDYGPLGKPLSVKEVAMQLGMCQTNVYRMLRSEKNSLPYTRITRGYRIYQAHLDKFRDKYIVNGGDD